MPVPRFTPIRTDRLVIRPMEPTDVDAVWHRRNDPTTAEFQNWSVPYERERAEELVRGMVELDGIPPSDGWFEMAVDDADTGDALGDLALHLTFDGRCAELGYTVAAEARGRGVATEAAAALARWVLETVGVTRVAAMMHPDNLASIRVAEQIGMVYEGHTHNSFWVGDVNSDDWYYGMTPESWREWVDRPRGRPQRVSLVEVTPENLRSVERLATHRSQRRFASTVAESFADALVPEPYLGHPVVPWFRAIEADGDLVGFLMMAARTEHHPTPYLWRLLVDRLHQRRGIGSAALELAIERARDDGSSAIETSWAPGAGSPEPLYLGRGFEPTGEIEDGEIVGRLVL